MTGELLKQVRSRLGLSCEEMASLLGATLRTYYRFEKAQKIPLTTKRLVITLLKSPQVLNADITAMRGEANAG